MSLCACHLVSVGGIALPSLGWVLNFRHMWYGCLSSGICGTAAVAVQAEVAAAEQEAAEAAARAAEADAGGTAQPSDTYRELSEFKVDVDALARWVACHLVCATPAMFVCVCVCVSSGGRG